MSTYRVLVWLQVVALALVVAGVATAWIIGLVGPLFSQG